jgi:hypothetical protein
LKALTESNEKAGSLTKLAGDDGPLALCAEYLKEVKAKLPDGPADFRQKLQWPFESKKINNTMGRIMAQFPILELAVAENNYAVSTEIRDSLKEMNRRNERRRALNWLSCVDPAAKHLASRALHQTGSNDWVIESKSFKEWRDNAGKSLWIHAVPGAGKTSGCRFSLRHGMRMPPNISVRRVFSYSFRGCARSKTLPHCG